MHEISKAKKIFNFPMFHMFRVFKDFPILSIPEQTTITPLVFGFFSQIKIPHKCNINTKHPYEHQLCKLPKLTKNQAQT